MKSILTFLLLITTLFCNAQEFDAPQLEFYTLEEAKEALREEGSYSWCAAPVSLICQILPQYKRFYLKPSDIDNLIPYKSIVNLEKVEKIFETYFLENSKYEFSRGVTRYDVTQEGKASFLERRYPTKTWNEYLEEQFTRVYSNTRGYILGQYSDGFMLFSKEDIEADLRSNLKSNFLSSTMGVWIENTNVVLQKEAEQILNNVATLVRTEHSLYERTSSPPEAIDKSNYIFPPEDLIWVFEDKAVGFRTKQLFRIVDESGEPINLLEDEVETRITFDEVTGVSIPKIRVIYTLIPVDSFE